MNKKVSIIVPVYNTERELNKCLASIVNQTIIDTEIIIVNDESHDNSEEIIKRFERKYNNIKYYVKKNSGVADTRNYGMSKATGEYIMFVDSDDYIDEQLLEKLEPYMNEKIDIIKFKLARVDHNGKVLEKVEGPSFEKIRGQEAFGKLYSEDVLLDSPCVYLFRREYLLENKFKFAVGTYHEDFGLIPLILVKAKSVVSVELYGYCYVQSQDSITRNVSYNKTLKKMGDSIYHYDNMVREIEKYNLRKQTQENLKIYYTNAIILKLNDLKEEDRKKFIRRN